MASRNISLETAFKGKEIQVNRQNIMMNYFTSVT